MSLSADQIAIRDAAREFLRASASFNALRKALAGADGCPLALWRQFAVELGFAGLAIPETQGGSGLGVAELALVAEELGATLAPIPWFESAVLATLPLIELGALAELTQIAAGRIATLAFRDAAGAPLPGAIGPEIRDGVLTGAAHFVGFGAVAELFIVVAREQDGLSIVAVDASAPGVKITPLTALDLTRPLATIQFNGVDVSDKRLCTAGAGEPPLVRALSKCGAILAAEQVGGMRRTIEETLAYAKQRVQFGRTIGSFQAVKHRFADMKLLLEGARSAVDWAISAIAANDPEAPLACASAQAYCADAYLKIAAEGVQLHGGIGFTWEHHAHLFFKRARSSSTMLDPPAHHREQVAHALLAAE